MRKKTEIAKRFDPQMAKTGLGIGGLVTGSLMGVLAVVETICRVDVIVAFLGVTPLVIYLGMTMTALMLLTLGLMFQDHNPNKKQLKHQLINRKKI